ncbi:MAG: dihydroneopterin aldolase, partial [Clostridiales bacterium]|nr:dihydroneopterin aldolase [Clostridiales bacterium]
MDRITISNLEVFAFHGVLKEENSLGQKFLVSAQLYTDIMEAAEEDDITKSINYASVCKTIDAFLKENTFKLIETTADRLAYHLLQTYPRISKIQVEVKKPWAPIHMTLDTVSVVVERKWHEVYLGIGSNLGDKEANLQAAIRML